MTQTTRIVFEKHQVRKSKKQKTAFIDYVQGVAAAEGYDCHVEKGYFGARNIVVGNPDRAKVIYTAHYDTCARLPFPNFITPKSIGIYLLYQIVLTVAMLGLPFLLMTGLGILLTWLTPISDALLGLILYEGWLICLVAEVALMMAGPANRHTANDNTSGVTVLLDTMQALPADLRADAAFIFFDLEEMGLFGSAGYASKHKAIMKNTLLLNFDCVSDGDTILFAVRKGAKQYADSIEAAFPPTDALRVEVVSKGVFYPSDQANFNRGVGVAALKSTRRGLLYMNRIHTSRDTVYKEDNIVYITNGAVSLTRLLSVKSGEMV